MKGHGRARAASPELEPEKRLLGVVSHAVEEVFASVEALRAAMVSLAERAHAAGRFLRRGDLQALRPGVAEILARHAGLVAGSGVVMAPDVLEDAQLWIEWWWSNDDAQPEPLLVDLDPESAEFYDYTTTEWYRVPERSGQRHIAGPYVDYICTHEYTFTLATPLLAGARFLGIAGADILASRVERMVLPALARLPRVAALASGNGRVISSNSTQLMPGMIVRREAAGAGLEPVVEPEHGQPIAALPWVLLEAPVSATPSSEPPPRPSPSARA
jgi:hypothetical protein